MQLFSPWIEFFECHCKPLNRQKKLGAFETPPGFTVAFALYKTQSSSTKRTLVKVFAWQIIVPLFDMVISAIFIFFSATFLNMCKPRTTFHLVWWAHPPGLAFCRSGLACLPSLQAGYVPRDQKFSCKWVLSSFKAVPPNRLSFYQGSPLYITSALFSHFCLFQNAILHNMFKLGFWNFQPIFLGMHSLLVATFCL